MQEGYGFVGQPPVSTLNVEEESDFHLLNSNPMFQRVFVVHFFRVSRLISCCVERSCCDESVGLNFVSMVHHNTFNAFSDLTDHDHNNLHSFESHKE